MHTARSNANQYISRLDIFTGDQIFLIYGTYRKPCQIVFVFRHQSRMFCRLAADQSASGLCAAFRYPLYDRCDLFRIVLSASNIIQEKQRFRTCACNIVHTHCHTVNSHGIVLIQQKCQFDLGTYAIRSGNQHRLIHRLDLFHRKSSGKTADPAKYLGAHRLCHILLHQFDRLIPCLNVYTGFLVIHFSPPFRYRRIVCSKSSPFARHRSVETFHKPTLYPTF